jgi:3-methylcrotonyl-CoA carboxylase alpha subunit
MFHKILIANRGEIACRVIATARRLGVATVAVYSDADAHALHVDLADEARPIGPARAQESYLAIDKILVAARQSGAEAIHPGYGFLSENPAFAEACANAGLCFIGPPPKAMRLMGSKAAAKALMQRAGVPILPGYHGETQDLATLAGAAKDIGFPVMIKASAAGGGKGMRIVERGEALREACEGARREALASFGDDRLLIEKYLVNPRHIEVQVFADQHGEIVAFFERDCSIQRRHQKIVEETPAWGLDPPRRRAMAEAAMTAARAAGYVGAGTVEFLVEDDRFYFLEMNARLQVEHPITEMISRQDLVEWQLRVACGERLPLTQPRLAMRGHAIEARICAEDPDRGFLPSTGLLRHLRQPREDENVRIDTGVRQGDRITQDYDPLIAKLIVWGEDRAAALQRLKSALAGYEIVGVAANLDLLRAIAAHPAFIAGESDVGFIDRHRARLVALSPTETEETTILAAGAMARLGDLRASAAAETLKSGDPWSPWGAADAWRIEGRGGHDIVFNREGKNITLRARPLPDGSYDLETPARAIVVSAAETEEQMSLRVDGVLRKVRVVREDCGLVVVLNGRNHFLRYVDPLGPTHVDISGPLPLTAPLPARVTRMLVGTGDFVKKGAPLVVLEAMKMEITLTAPSDGVVADVKYGEGDVAPEGAELVVFAAGEAA